jgi:heat shock protein HtpX
MKNQLKTVILLALLTALLLWVGSLFGTSGLIIGIVFAVLLNFGSYWFSDRVVLAMYRAKKATKATHPELFSIVEEVRHAFRLPMPAVYIIPSAAANAFATGRNPQHAAVACTEGILALLSKSELRGVIAHEMAHINNRDTLIQAITGMIAGVISYAAMVARWGAIFGGFGNNRDSGNLFELLALAIVTPIIATLIQLAISRSREYLADQTAAKKLHAGSGLADALEKLEKDNRPLRFGSQGTAHLFISNPFKGRSMMSLLSTHPSTSERVRRLRSMRF